MSDSDEGSAVDLPRLYKQAANAKRSLTRAKKEFQNSIKALSEAVSSQHFFDELLKSQDTYKKKRIAVFEIYDNIEDEVSDEKFQSDFGRQTKEIEKDYDGLEEAARVAISSHHNAMADIAADISRARAAGGGGGGGSVAPRWKLEPSFEPKPPLQIAMGGEELANWERQFKMYYDISNLKHADIATQRAVLQNCLHTDLQVKLHEGISGILDIKAGLTLIRDQFKKLNPRVVRRHHLFSLEQRKDEYSFSDTITRMDALARDADLTDLSKDAILCHLILRACKDENLRAKMLEVPEDEMTQLRLKEVVDLYETIQRTNTGLGEKEKVKRTKTGEGNTCYRCQEKDSKHFASSCPVPAKSLFCRTCAENGVEPPHSHNFFPGCKGKRQEKKEEVKENKDDNKGTNTAKTEGGKSKRIKARGQSPAGQPESSDSEEEEVHARRVQTRGTIEEEVPAGSAYSTDNDEEEDDPVMDSGWASEWASSTEEEEEEEEAEEDSYLSGNAVFVHMTVRSYKAADPENSRATAEIKSNEKGPCFSAEQARGGPRGGPLEQLLAWAGQVPVQQKQAELAEMQCKSPCSPRTICAIITVVVLLLLGAFIKWIGAEEEDETTNNLDPEVSGNDNQVDIRNANKHEISLLHIDNLASSQRITNGLMLGGFVTVLLIAGFAVYRYKTTKTDRRREKSRERREMLNKIQAVENEMVSRGFMKKKKVKKMKNKKSKVKRCNKGETDIEARKMEQMSTSGEDSE